jgi:hypothetical protein
MPGTLPQNDLPLAKRALAFRQDQDNSDDGLDWVSEGNWHPPKPMILNNGNIYFFSLIMACVVMAFCGG